MFSWYGLYKAVWSLQSSYHVCWLYCCTVNVFTRFLEALQSLELFIWCWQLCVCPFRRQVYVSCFIVLSFPPKCKKAKTFHVLLVGWFLVSIFSSSFNLIYIFLTYEQVPNIFSIEDTGVCSTRYSFRSSLLALLWCYQGTLLLI